MHTDIAEILFDEAQLECIVNSLAERINKDYSGKTLEIIGILKGSVVFLADLIRKLEIDCTLDFITASSYGAKTVSSGKVRLDANMLPDLKNKHILLVEDILDTGSTLAGIKNIVYGKGAFSAAVCTLFNKPSRREKPIKAEYVGTDIPDKFVVGYGLDYNDRYRNLPYVGVLKPEIYTGINKIKE